MGSVQTEDTAGATKNRVFVPERSRRRRRIPVAWRHYVRPGNSIWIRLNLGRLFMGFKSVGCGRRLSAVSEGVRYSIAVRVCHGSARFVKLGLRRKNAFHLNRVRVFEM